MRRLIFLVGLALLAACSGAEVGAEGSSTSVLAATTVAPTTTSVAPSAPPAKPWFQEEVERWRAEHEVVGAVVIVVDGLGLAQEMAVGFRDLQMQAASQTTDRYRIGSITKVYAAALIMSLIEQGLIDLEQSAAQYVPNLPAAVTISQLLSHTAGLRDVDVLAGVFEAVQAGGAPETSADSLAEALERGLAYEPGALQRYSSIGYLALERVIEGVTGQPWDVLLAEQVLAPEATTALEDDAMDLPTPYERLGPASPPISLRSLPTTQFARNAGAAGGLVATAADVAGFVRALFAGSIVGPESLASMMDSSPPREQYGLGLAFYDIGPTPVFGHNGRTIGFASSVRHDPASNVTVVVLSNDGFAPTDELADQLVVAAVSDG